MSGGPTPPRRSIADVAVGEEVPPYTLPLTIQRMVMEAAAARDFAPIHHDPAAANATGAPDVYAGTLFIESMLEAALRQWAGLGAWFRDFEMAIRDFTLVGDVATAGGVVREAPVAGTETSALVDVWIDTQRGRTVEGTVLVEFR